VAVGVTVVAALPSEDGTTVTLLSIIILGLASALFGVERSEGVHSLAFLTQELSEGIFSRYVRTELLCSSA
jgi:TctA family transporter